MGMSYNELSIYGRLRKIQKCGPYSMFVKLIQEWGGVLSPVEVSFDPHPLSSIVSFRAQNLTQSIFF